MTPDQLIGRKVTYWWQHGSGATTITGIVEANPENPAGIVIRYSGGKVPVVPPRLCLVEIVDDHPKVPHE